MQDSRVPTKIAQAGFAVGLLAAALAAAGCGKHAEPAAANRADQPVPVTVASAEHRSIDRTIDVVGTLRGSEEVTVGAKKWGRVAKVLHDIGDRVEPGTPLLELEMIDSGLALAQAEKRLLADLAMLGLKEVPQEDFDVSKVPSVVSAQVAVERAGQNLEREQQLTARNATTLQRLQDAEHDLKRAKADLDHATLAAQATLATALASQVALEVAQQSQVDMVVRAPVPSREPTKDSRRIDYAITKRTAAEGQMVREGDSVFQLMIDDPLRLIASVPERFIPDVNVGQKVLLEVASYPGREFIGQVARINPAVDPASRTFLVEIGVENDEHLLRPGSFAEGKILTDHQELATIVPLEAVVRYAGVIKVFLVQGDQAREVRVVIGDQGPGWMQVSGEIPEKSQVITSGQTQLAEGTPITIRSPAAAAAAKPTGGPQPQPVTHKRSEEVPPSEPPRATNSAGA